MQDAGEPMRDTTTTWMQERDTGTLPCVTITPFAHLLHRVLVTFPQAGATAALRIRRVATLTRRLTATMLGAAMARHRAASHRSRWRRSSAPPVVTVQRLPGIEVVDAQTGMAHQVSAEELRAGRARWEYEALCGVRFLAASMLEPGRGRCSRCAS
jgi:hypothetical protein